MNKKILLSLGAAIVLLAYIFLRDYKPSGTPDLEKWEGEVTEMSVDRPSGSIQLKKKAGVWNISPGEYPADSAVVNGMIKKAKDLELIDVVSGEKRYVRYDLVPEKQIRVELKKDGRAVRILFVGKKTSTGRQTYIRVEGIPGVLLADGTFQGEFEKKIDDIRDKEILRVTRDSVESFGINCGGKKLSFYKKAEEAEKKEKAEKGKDEKAPLNPKTSWVCRGYEGVALDTNRVDAIISSLNPLKASGFRKDGKKGLSVPLCSVKIKIMNRDISFYIYSKDSEGRYPVSTSESEYVYFADEWKVKKYMVKGIGEIRKK